MNACDPDADIENLRKLIKLNTGVDIKLTKKEICNAYQDIQDGKLPLPPMVMNSSRTYLVDKKSPLKPNDYEQLFDASTKRADLKRIARKVDLKNVEQMTKSQIVDAIGKRLRYMKVHEPVKFARRRQVVSVNNNVNTAVNNTAVNVNNTNVNRVNNVGRTNNTNVNRVNNVGRTNNTNVNRVNTNFNTGRTNTNFNAGRTNNTNVNRVNNTNVNRVNRQTKVNFPTGGLFRKGNAPKFLGGPRTAPTEKKKGFFAGLFGKKNNKNYIAANKFKGSKEGYVFRKGEKGLGYYLNTGRVQGPQLPSANITRPIPANEDFALELAVARVKQLGLKREKKFLNQIQLGTKKRKQVVIEAEQSKEEENQFLAFLEQLDISNTNRNSFKQRMATDDFGQIKVEAQIKADEKANVARTSEEKMGMFLKTTGLTNANKQLFINKARKEGSNINALIEEARKLNANIKGQKIEKKKDEFRKILQNYNKLSNADKDALVQEVGANANSNMMRQMADKLVQKRIEEKKNATAQNLLSFLTPLEINQKNKDEFLRRFKNEGANINSIKTEALKLQESKGSANVEALRVRLNTRLGEIGLNSVNKNAIMKKFRNGNRNVNKLIEEAKVLKTQRGVASLNEAKKDYRAYINGLPGLTNADKAELTKNNGMNRNRAKQMSNKRLQNMKIESKQGFIKFMSELGITNQYRNELLSDFNSNSMTMNALKNKATRVAQQIRNKKNSELKTQLNTRLGEIGLNQVNKNIIMKKFTNGEKNVNKLLQEAKSLKSGRNAEKLDTKRKEFVAFLNSLPGLTNEDRTDLLKNDALNRSRAKQMSNKRLQNMKIESKQGFIKFISELGITNQYRNELLSDFNSNRMTMNALKNKATRVAQQIRNKKNSELKTQLNTRLGEIGLNQVNKNIIMKKFTNGEKNVNKLLQEAKSLKSGRNAEKLNTKRKEFVAFLNSLPGLTNEDKADLLKNTAMNRSRAKQMSNKRLQNMKIESKQGFIKFMSELGITNQYRNDLLDDFNANSMTMNALKNKATRVAQQIRNKKNSELKTRLNTRLGEIGLNQVNKNMIMKKFTNGEKNVNKLLQEAKSLKSGRNAEKLDTKRKEFASFLNSLPGLTNEDKADLLKNNGMNRNRAKRVSNKRLQNAKIESKQGFIKFMSELGITNQYRNDLLDDFNANSMTMNALKNKATRVAQQIRNKKNSELKTRLNTRLGEIGLNQVNKNAIMKKFTNGEKNVNKLLQEAKNVKSMRNAEILNTKRKEYSAFLNTLKGLTLDDKAKLMSNNGMNRNKAKVLSNQRLSNQKGIEKAQFEKFLMNLGLNNGDRKTMLNKYNSNSLTVNALQKVAQELKAERVQQQKAVNKKTLMEYLENMNIPRNTKINIERRFNTNQANLKTLQSEVNKIVKNARNAKLAKNKAAFTSNVQASILSGADKNALIRSLDVGNVNITALRNKLNTMVKKMVETQRAKDRDELEEYMKSQGVSAENQKTVLSKFNVNSKIALTNLKQEANAILASRVQEKREANTAVLTNRAKQLGLTNQETKNLTNKLNREKLESLMNEANAIAKRKAQNKKNQIEREKSNYINKLGLNANNKRNILAQNLNLNSTKSLANQTLQKRIAERRAKNMTKLNLHLNKLNLNNQEKRKFYNNFNRNVNLNTIMKNATNFEAKKKANIKSAQLEDLKKFLNQQGLNGGEQRQFINRLKKNQDDLAALKVEAKNFMDEKFKQLKAKKRGELVNVLKGLSNLTQNDINGILKNFDNTNVNGNVLKKRAQEINKSRKDERYAQNEEEFYGYLNTLQNLTPQNRTEITAKLNGYFTNWNAIKQLATNTAVGRAKERRAAEKADLNNYMTNMGFNNNSKRIFFKDLDDGKYIKNVKANAAAYKKDLDAKRKATARKGFVNLLNTLYLNKSDQNALLEQFNDETTGLNQLQNKARAKEANTIERNRSKLTLYLSDELKLNSSDVNLLVKNYNADPRSLNTLRNRGRQLKNVRNEEERKEIRRQVKEYLNGLNLLNNKNKQNIINKNLPYKNAKAEGNKAQEFKRMAKRGAEREKLVNAVKNLSNADQKNLLNKFNTRNVTLNSMLNEAKDLKTKRATEKRARERNELYNALNGLNMNVADRNTIMNKFNKSNATVNALRNEAVKLKNQRVAQKHAQNRGEIESILNETNLSASNKTSILNKFNANKNQTLNSMRVMIKELSNQRKVEKRLVNRVEVEKYLQKVGLSNTDTKTVLNRFNANTSISLKDASNEANALLIKRVQEKTAANRAKLVEHMNGLNITNANRVTILKNFDSEAASLNNLKTRATNINTAVKAKAAQRRELSNYINGLGINGNDLINKFNNGRSTLNSLKKEANKRRTEANAKIVNNKKKELNAFMNDTFIPKANRKAFLNRITANTNMNAIKSNVKNVDNGIRAKKEKEAKNMDEFVTFLNGLELTNKEKVDLLKNYSAGKTNKNALRNKAVSINAAVKAKAAQRKELSNYINSLNVNGKNLLNKFNNGNSTLNSLKKEANKRRTEANAKLVNNKRKELNAFMNDTFIPKANRKAFLNRITVNTNMNAIKSNVKNMNNGIRAQKEKEAKNRDEFSTFLNGLELTNKEKTDLLKNYNAGKTNKNVIRNKAVSINAAVKAKAAQRKELSNYINSLKVNGKNLLNKFNNGNSTLNSLKKEANKRRVETNAKIVNNKKKELNTFMSNTLIPKANRQAFLNRITVNTNMNTIKSNVKNVDNGIRAQKEKEAKNRDEFVTFLNGLELTNKEKTDLLKNYNAGKTNKNALRNKAVSINAAVKAKAAQRQELSNYINSLKVNGKNLLNKFNNGNSTLNSLKKEANKRRTEANAKLVNNKKKELNTFMNDTFIPKANRQAFLNRITVNTNMNAIKSNVKNVDNGIRAQKEKEAKNRDEFVTFLNGLELTNKDKGDLLKNYNTGKTNKNVIRNKALSINAAVKAKAAQRQELSNYINSLGINGKAILNKFNNGRSSIDKLKKEADKLKSLSDAKIVKNKRDDIRAFMKETRLPNSNKNSFVNRIEVNTNMNTIKREIKELNSVLKGRNDELARKKTELSTYLNGLNDLTSNQRSELLKRVVNANTNIQELKNEGVRLNKNVKNKRVEQKRLEEEKRIKEVEAKKALNQKKFENHLRGLKHLTSKEMEGYAKNLANGKATLEDLIAVSKAKNADNEKDKDAMRNYVRKASIPQTKKNVYLKQLNTPYVNITPIKGLVNANVETQKKELQKLIKNAEAKLKKITELSADERGRFKIRLQSESVSNVLEEAQKLSVNRKEAKKARNQEKKNVATKLQGLTSLERNNRKKLMNRLATNGANKVVANAQALNKERKDKKARDQQIKNVATKLQALTSLKRENRKSFMNRLGTNGPNKVVANAQALDKQRKDKQEAEKRMIEDRRKAEEARKKAEEAKKKLRNLQTKKLATKLQALTSLKRENRKSLMNRVEKNGYSKVLGNAQALNKERKEDAARIRGGVETKLKTIGVKGANLQALMKRWNNSKNKTIFNDARKKVESEKARVQPLLNKVERVVSKKNSSSQAWVNWKGAIRAAKNNPASLKKIEKLLDDKEKLKTKTLEAIKDLPPREQYKYTLNLTAYKDDVAERQKKLDELRKTKDKATKETAEKLQSLNRLGRDNRKRFMNRIAGGENAKKVLANADKLQSNRVKKQKNEADRKKKEQEASRERKEKEKKTRDYEKGKQAKLRANTAKMLQGMTGLQRANRKAFMNRLQRGNDPAKIISNAQKKSASVTGFSFNKRPTSELRPMTTKERFNVDYAAPTKSSAIREIRTMRGIGAKSQNKFVKRIDGGEKALKVLTNAKVANKKARGMTSKTKRQLQKGVRR
jgi:hypothetical protein